MNWSELWMNMFGTTTWAGLDIGFWLSMGISLLVALAMGIGFWCTKPLSKRTIKPKRKFNLFGK